jgi:DNA relaxase NicK
MPYGDKITVRELIKKLSEIKDQDLEIEVSTGHFDKGGRFYGKLHRISIKEDYGGKRVLLTGELQSSEEDTLEENVEYLKGNK